MGAIIAGGQGTRFGSDKLLTPWRGQSLIDHSIAALAPHVDRLVICGRDIAGSICLPDRPVPDIGPLGGLCAALCHAQAEGFSYVVSIAADVHPLPPHLPTLLGGEGAAVLASQWLIGSWPVHLCGALQEHISSGHRSIRSWLEICRPRIIDDSDMRLININRPADLARLEMRNDAMETARG